MVPCRASCSICRWTVLGMAASGWQSMYVGMGVSSALPVRARLPRPLQKRYRAAHTPSHVRAAHGPIGERGDGHAVLDDQQARHDRLPPPATVAADGVLHSGGQGVQVEGFGSNKTMLAVDVAPRQARVSAPGGQEDGDLGTSG